MRLPLSPLPHKWWGRLDSNQQLPGFSVQLVNCCMGLGRGWRTRTANFFLVRETRSQLRQSSINLASISMSVTHRQKHGYILYQLNTYVMYYSLALLCFISSSIGISFRQLRRNTTATLPHLVATAISGGFRSFYKYYIRIYVRSQMVSHPRFELGKSRTLIWRVCQFRQWDKIGRPRIELEYLGPQPSVLPLNYRPHSR